MLFIFLRILKNNAKFQRKVVAAAPSAHPKSTLTLTEGAFLSINYANCINQWFLEVKKCFIIHNKWQKAF